MTILGVLADTHIPDRAAELDPRIEQCYRQASVEAILHAGDVSVPAVIRQLEQIAPVVAVQGNRDIFALRHLPMQVRLNVAGVSIGMAHGHGSFTRYMVDKLQRSLYGRMDEVYLRRMRLTFPDVEVIIFGHVHVPCNLQLDGQLVFNPGSTSYPWPRSDPPSFGLLYLEKGQAPRGEIIQLHK